MELYEYTIEENKIFDKYCNEQQKLDSKLVVPDTLDNYKHNLKVKKKQLELAKYYRDKERAEKLKMDINYYIAKIKKEENNVYDTLFSHSNKQKYSEQEMDDYTTLLSANKQSTTEKQDVFDTLFSNTKNGIDFSEI